MKTSPTLTACAIALFSGLTVWWLLSGPQPAAEHVMPTVAAQPAEPLPARVEPGTDALTGGMEPAPDRIDDTAQDPEIALERLALVGSDPELLDKARQQSFAEEADARWADAVDEAGYSPQDLDPAVRGFFSSVDLEPRYAEGGRIEGLVITGIREDHPLALAGFRVGDRLSRIQGVALQDPADIPSLLARLGPHFSVCSASENEETCKEMVLR